MKVVIGIDLGGLYESALNLLSRLQFAEVNVELVHIDEAPPFYPDENFSWTPELLEVQEKADSKVLTNAEQVATARGFPCEKLNFLGSPAEVLMEQADCRNADLIAIGSNQKSAMSSLFFGSVGRALAIGAKHSVLIAKGEVGPEGPLTAVMTTDHSKYSDQAIRLLARLKPQGIKRLVILSALDEDTVNGADETHIDRYRNYLNSRSETILEHFTSAGIPAEIRIVEGELDKAIDAQMHELNADLLIMGAQGHGFIQRLFIGSRSLKQVVATKHSILLLRP